MSIQKKSNNSISNTELYKLGLSNSQMGFVNSLTDLRNDIPKMIICEAILNIPFSQQYAKEQVLRKHNKYIMNFGFYQQMHKDPSGKKLLKPSTFKFSNLYKPYMGQDLTNKTILVFRTGGIGDLLFIQPNLIHMKKKWPSCKIIFGCGPQYQSMVENWDCVDEVIDLPLDLSRFMSADYHCIFEGVIERCKEAEIKSSYTLFTEWMGLNLPDEELIPSQKAKDEKVQYCQTLINDNNIPSNFVLLQMRASSGVRTPSPKFWKYVIDGLIEKGMFVCLNDMPQYSKEIDNFISTLENKSMVFNFAKYSDNLDTCIAMASLCKMVVGVDSSLVHIGASLDKPVYGIYGPFPGNLRLNTYKNCKWVDSMTPSVECKCAPCFMHGKNPCHNAFNGYPICFNKFDKDLIINQICELYE